MFSSLSGTLVIQQQPKSMMMMIMMMVMMMSIRIICHRDFESKVLLYYSEEQHGDGGFTRVSRLLYKCVGND